MSALQSSRYTTVQSKLLSSKLRPSWKWRHIQGISKRHQNWSRLQRASHKSRCTADVVLIKIEMDVWLLRVFATSFYRNYNIRKFGSRKHTTKKCSLGLSDVRFTPLQPLYTVSQIKRGHFSFRHNFYSCQAKNFENSLTTVKVMTKTKVAPFYLGHGV